MILVEKIYEMTYKGIDCKVRHLGDTDSGKMFCGYVFIPFSISKSLTMDPRVSKIPVHGGITYFKTLNDYYVLGFDTGHIGDSKKDINLQYIQKELEKMIDYLIEEKIVYYLRED